MHRGRFTVATVELGLVDLLLDEEHVSAELRNRVDLVG
jgi:hypothetical protein